MNIPFIIAALLLLLACIVHIVMGDRKHRQLCPGQQPNITSHGNLNFAYWLSNRCIFHIASVDLLASAILILFMGLGIIPFSRPLALFLTILYFAYLGVWLLTLYLSDVQKRDYLRQGQWILFMLVFLLLATGTGLAR